MNLINQSWINFHFYSHQASNTKKNVPLLKVDVSGIALNKLCPDDTLIVKNHGGTKRDF